MLLSVGDIIDLYYQLFYYRSTRSILPHFFISPKRRTQSWWSETSSIPRNWWSVPEVVKYWQKKITGNPEVTYMEYIKKKFFCNKTGIRLLSPGCGDGEKECFIAKKFPHWHITGFDLNEKRIAQAKLKTENKSLLNISFSHADIYDLHQSFGCFDILLFDSSLHHFTDFDRLLPNVRTLLSNNGILIINEYIGPDRFQWTDDQLKAANHLLSTIPASFRKRIGVSTVKKKIYRPGILRMLLSDPSEAAASSQILPSIHRYFTTVEEVPLGGNLLHLVLKDIAHNFISCADKSESTFILKQCFDIEQCFLNNHTSDFLFGIYT